ncbi:MAG: DNA polymerase/3'-5' exonuclease PolX [Peptococcaceae bacterium]
MDKKKAAKILHEISVFLELKGENQFKIRAYQNGARTIEMLDEDLAALVETGRIKAIKGIGNTLAGQVTELIQTGDLAVYHELKNGIPEGLLEMLTIPGLGPKKAYHLYETLGIASIAELEYACKENRLLELKGFGPKSQLNILQGIEHVKKYRGQFIYGDVYEYAEEIAAELKKCPALVKISIAGSLRRFKEVVKDIDLLASSAAPGQVMEYFCSLTQVGEIIARGDTKTSLSLKSGINVDLRVVKPDEFYYALHHFTGSKEHNTAMRHRAKGLGIKINEYGLFSGDARIDAGSEEEFFAALGLPFIPPELRENMGEIEAGERGKLPRLITEQDVKGVFHIHTNYSDGVDELDLLVKEARKAGYNFLGISDHSQAAVYAGGLKLADIKRQQEEISKFNRDNPDFYVFHGIEADIHPDGSLDYPDEVLAMFDFVIASVHSAFSISAERATERLITAMSNPYVTMLGHPTGRILLGRKGYEPDMEKVIQEAKKHNVIIELNASPYRLDIDWRHLKYAKETGVKISINPDAHRKEEIYETALGVKMARKGWLEKEDVFNTLAVEEIKDYFNKFPKKLV